MCYVFGRVNGLEAGESSNANIIASQDNKSISIRPDSTFTIDNLQAGFHSFILRIVGRQDIPFDFEITATSFNGLVVTAGTKVATGAGNEAEGAIFAKLTDKAVPFETGKFDLLQGGKDTLYAAFTSPMNGVTPLDQLKDPSLRIAIIGQADPRPFPESYNGNLGLSAERAASVGNYLTSTFPDIITPDRIIVIGLGDQWLPARHNGESDEYWWFRCRRILVMKATSSDTSLISKVQGIE